MNGDSNIGSCSVAQKGTFLTALNAARTKGMVWIVDSGASNHMTGTTKVFSSYIPSNDGQKIKIADGTLSSVAGKGTVSFSDSLELNSVFYVLNLSCNLLSVRKLTKDLNCTAKFFPSCCEFQDLSSGRTIRKARECDGLYYYEDSAVENGQSNVAGSELGFFSSNDEIMSWHFRLGHPNFLYLKSFFPALFGNKNVYDFQCEICQIAKSHKNTYPLRQHKVSQPFSLIHSDIWSPSRVPNLTNTKWFISFIDDHTQICWIYLLKEK